MKEQVVLARNDLNELFMILRDQGYAVIGPTIQGGAIIFGETNL